MLKKMTVCAVLTVLLAGGISFAAERQGREKARQDQVQKNRAQRTDLVGQLIRAYNAGNRQKVGNVIGQMEQRRARARSAEKPRQGNRKAGAGQRAGGGQKPLGDVKMQKGQRQNRGGGRLQQGFAEPGPARQAAGAGKRGQEGRGRAVTSWHKGSADTGKAGWHRGAMAGRMGRQGGRGERAMGMRRWQGMRQRRGAMGIRRWQGRGQGQRRMWRQGRGGRDNSASGRGRIPEARFDWDW